MFATGIEQALPMYTGTTLRVFMSPAMNALGVIFILSTITGAICCEVARKKEISNE